MMKMMTADTLSVFRININMKKIDLIESICEEFTDVVITDKKKNSVILHLPKKYYKELNKRLTEKGFELTFKKAINSSHITVSYTLIKKK